MVDIKNLPDVNFCETDTTEIQKNAYIVYRAITGRTLAPGNPERLFLETLIALIAQQRVVINYTGKQNLLGCANQDFLDHLGAITETSRLEAGFATTTIKYSIDTALDFAVSILEKSRVAPSDGSLIFETEEYAEIPAGETSIEVSAICTEAGSLGNDYLPGQVNQMVDVVPYISAVENTTITSGGADIEDDESYRDRIHKSPSKFSVAGPGPAYEFWAKTAHQDISDVAVYRESPLDDVEESKINAILDILEIDYSEMTLSDKKIQISNILSSAKVNICPLLTDGALPDPEIIDQVNETLSDKTVRPLTDQVEVTAPEVVSFDLDMTYYVATSDIPVIENIKVQVDAAVSEYLLWQKSKIGRDINPDKLIQLVKNAGAKRVEIVTPVFQVLNTNQVAQPVSVSAIYGGAEDE
ncbi:MAG: baseplate J/gp47 family protein [Desulfobacteraceae bacterium]|nr:baseplate J/gp47 family protein [Desulfobacteraceae bacterium]